MLKRTLAASAIATLFVSPAHAVSDAEWSAMKEEIRQMKIAYESRIAELENRVKAAETKAAMAEGKAIQSASAPSTARPAASALNPEISLILQGRYHSAEGDGRITGFLPAGDAHGGDKGFSADHTELVLSAGIDPYFRGYANFAIGNGEIETEEVWVQTTALGNGFTVKGGRFLSGIGYANELHPHAWDFANQNLAYAAMLGEHYGQDGLQLKWLAPTPVFLEFGMEAGQGTDWSDRNNLGSYALFAHVGDDLGDSHSWRAGLSYLNMRADGREGHWYDDNDVEAETLFSGKSKYWVADLVWKWAPDGNPRYQNFKFQAEYLRRSESGELACEDNAGDGGACAGGITGDYRARQSGWYAQGIYQFHPQWRVGYRYDRLNVGSVNFGPEFTGVLSRPSFTPNRHSLMVDYNPSEFSRLRLQLAQDKAEQGMTDNQVTLQYLYSLGAHGAHKF